MKFVISVYNKTAKGYSLSCLYLAAKPIKGCLLIGLRKGW